MRLKYKVLAAVGAAAMAAGAASAQTETLRGALEQTYRSNPTLMAQREQLRVLDESVAVARAGLRPTVAATVGLNQDVITTNDRHGEKGKAGIHFQFLLAVF